MERNEVIRKGLLSLIGVGGGRFARNIRFTKALINSNKEGEGGFEKGARIRAGFTSDWLQKAC